MFRIILFLSLCIAFPEKSRAQFDTRSDDLQEDSSTAGNDPQDDNADGHNLTIENDIGYEKHMEREPLPEFNDNNDLTEYYIHSPDSKKYLASIKIDRLFRPGREDVDRAGGSGLLMIGVKKPYYRLSRTPYIRGKLDFSLRGSFFGIENRGLITFSYSLESENRFKELSSSIFIERISFSINIPLGAGQ
jgi:hypothetical protein